MASKQEDCLTLHQEMMSLFETSQILYQRLTVARIARQQRPNDVLMTIAHGKLEKAYLHTVVQINLLRMLEFYEEELCR